MNPWWLYRPPCAHLGHISVQTWIDGSDPPSQTCPFLDQLLGVILLRWMSFHMPACASLCEGAVVSGHRQLQDLCSEEQQGVKLSHDPSWSLKQFSFHGFYSSFVVWNMKGSACPVLGSPDFPLPGRITGRSLSCFLFCTEFMHENSSHPELVHIHLCQGAACGLLGISP